ncbi:MAG: hypothetical protein ACRDH5_13495 [bacterium]
MLPAEHGKPEPLELPGFPDLPRLLEPDRLDPGHDVDPTGSHADLEQRSRGAEVALGRIAARRTEVVQRTQRAARVLGRRADPDVEIPGGPRAAVRGHRVGSDDQVLNALRGQRGQHVAIVGVHRRGLP